MDVQIDVSVKVYVDDVNVPTGVEVEVHVLVNDLKCNVESDGNIKVEIDANVDVKFDVNVKVNVNDDVNLKVDVDCKIEVMLMLILRLM